MFHLILTGVTFLLITHSATANPISTQCDNLLAQVDTVWATLLEAVPQVEPQAQQVFAMLNFDITNADEVRYVVCAIADATSQKELAQTLKLPFGQFKAYYAQGQMVFGMMGGIEGLENSVITVTTVLRELADGGFPNWPLTNTYDEWLTALNQLVDEVGPNFMQYLVPPMTGINTPTIEDPAYLAQQLTDASSLEDFCERMNMNFNEVSSILSPFNGPILMGKVDEATALIHAAYDLIEYADSIELLSLPVQ